MPTVTMRSAIVAAALIVLSAGQVAAQATYRATGNFSGSFCRFLVCKMLPVVAYSRNGAPLEAMPELFADVSEFNGSTGLCWIKPEKSGMRFHGHDEAGALKDLGEPDYIVFPCIRQ